MKWKISLSNNIKLGVLRKELKFFVDKNQLALLRKKILPFTSLDFNCKSFNNDYVVRSLYFDNIYDKNLDEKLDGILSREKIRIRSYRKNDLFKLEFKKRYNSLIQKDSYLINKNLANNLSSNRFLYDSFFSYPNELDKAVAKMRVQGLFPRIVVEYDREAYIHNHGNTRITIDKNLRYLMPNNFMSTNLNAFPIFDDNHTILEVKFTNYLPRTIKNALQGINAISHSISKYVHCQKFTDFNHTRDPINIPF